ncbi:MAG: acetate--CoA ligase [Gammaproteobacteria bacterium]|nr:acetate--CoA ligase [Gammaproteobacteria bacterium]
MSTKKLYPVSKTFEKSAYINETQYKKLYQHSIEQPDEFWAAQAKEYISWFKPWTQVKNGDFKSLDINWFIDGKLNASYNCLDRHLENNKNTIAILWQGDDPKDVKRITFTELHEQVCRFANVLKQNGIKKGDRVCIYLPMIPEAAVAMLACVRIGAIHSVVFSAFSSNALQTRIQDAECSLLITADEGMRGGKANPLKKNADIALQNCPTIKRMIVIKRTGNPVAWDQQRDIWYHEAMQNANVHCDAEIMDANDPLFILYTSGSTGNPKGVLHTTGGYLVYVAMTFKMIFDYHPKDIFWCTADIGWITGHSYLIYGPLLNAATTLMFEGVPHYPTVARFWETIDQHQVNIFYTAPTAIRALRKEGDQWVKKTKRNSLKILGTVGEPINPDVWEWYYTIVGEQRCPIVDTWWQTETGGILLTPLPGATPLKPGAASWPFFGIQAAIVDEKGNPTSDGESGKLVIKQPWPGLMKTIYKNPKRFADTYFKEIPDTYLTGDDALRDSDGYFWITGRDDDVIKVSGHRIGTGEVESALLTHPNVSEAAVVAIPHAIKGNAIYAYVTLKSATQSSDALNKELIQTVRNAIGPIATPEVIQWANDLPKTRSGKIMRRILRKIALNQFDDLGDTSTLSDANVVDDLIAERKKMKVVLQETN